MPYQAVPPMLIIIAAFNVSAGLMYGIHRVAYGTVRYVTLRAVSREIVHRIGR